MKALVLHRSEIKLAAIAAVPLKEIIDSVQFTQREFSTWSENGQVDKQFDLFYQRPVNIERLNSLKKYIEEMLFNDEKQEVLFPTSILLGFDLIENDLEIDQNGILELNFLERNDILIIDGQHRMKALKALYDKYNKIGDNDKKQILGNLKLNCTLLINYDIWDQAKIFADVNFKQKPVDKSLYYDIFGEFYDEKKPNNTLYISHQLGKFLNTNSRSPLKGFVKNFNTKGGFVSQAFVTTSLMNLLGPRGPWNYISEKFLNDNSYQTSVPNMIVGYFNVIKKQFINYWPNDLDKNSSTILSKTTALGAFFKLLGLIDDRLRKGLLPGYDRIDLIKKDQQEIEQVFDGIFSKFSTKNNQKNITLGEELFGENSPYIGGGSLGQQTKLYKEMAEIIGIHLNRKL